MTLSEFMAARGLRDADLINPLGIGRSMITKIRLRRTKPSFDVAARIVKLSDGAIAIEDLRPIGAISQSEATPPVVTAVRSELQRESAQDGASS